MNDYSFYIAGMTWSYSRLTTFEDCRYRFLLRYILREEKSDQKFFASYGTLIHRILAETAKQRIGRREALALYLGEFADLPIDLVSPDVRKKYYEDGKDYLTRLEPPEEPILSVEQKVKFRIGRYPFVGYIDLVTGTNKAYTIVDHKTRILSSKRSKKATRSYDEFVRYARQLYLYSIATEALYGVPPQKIRFNCFRNGTSAEEPFIRDRQQEAKRWAESLIEEIVDCRDWKPTLDWFRCRNLCDYFSSCEYAQTNFGN
ncbi:MAG: PD-(D/E)XK nuclease family protein [Bacteroides sp.]|nr:PD-(D/E)XK nuclease family protein [Eubacterium sp.]MCM1417644.1 PD-(D/E)XK nuclease family protein [Roseburia sp.]MCM1461891.1 PD-(D/E)XK nuclease family protein [Bacteroides sp.]